LGAKTRFFVSAETLETEAMLPTSKAGHKLHKEEKEARTKIFLLPVSHGF